jgi:hypothetical protein
MLKSILAASAAVMVMSTPALATVPVLSGTYIVNFNEVCQANTNSGSASSGESHAEILTITFNNVSGNASLSGMDVNGALVVMGGTATGYTTSPITGSSPYTNTRNTLTLGGVTFNIIYGAAKKGIVQSMVFNGITLGNCAASAMANHQ